MTTCSFSFTRSFGAWRWVSLSSLNGDSSPWGSGSSWWMLHAQRFRWVHRGASVTSLKYCRITFYCSFTSASLELCISKVTYHFYVFLWAESGKRWAVMPSGLLWLWIFHFFSFVYLCCSTGVAALLGVPKERETGTPTWWNPQTHSWFLLQTDWSIWIVWAGVGQYFLGKRWGGGCLDCYINFVIFFYSTSIQLT